MKLVSPRSEWGDDDANAVIEQGLGVASLAGCGSEACKPPARACFPQHLKFRCSGVRRIYI